MEVSQRMCDAGFDQKTLGAILDHLDCQRELASHASAVVAQQISSLTDQEDAQAGFQTLGVAMLHEVVDLDVLSVARDAFLRRHTARLAANAVSGVDAAQRQGLQWIRSFTIEQTAVSSWVPDRSTSSWQRVTTRDQELADASAAVSAKAHSLSEKLRRRPNGAAQREQFRAEAPLELAASSPPGEVTLDAQPTHHLTHSSCTL
jgi:hypothetical protein